MMSLMIYSVSGILTAKKGQFVVIKSSGLGLKIFVPKNVLTDLPAIDTPLTLFCHLHVREDALDLYGFVAEAELQLFESLLSVSGVGPKSALNVLSVTKADQLVAAIRAGQTELLTRASGIGKKTAERIVLELKSRLEHIPTAATLGLLESDMEVEDALIGLGYSRADAKAAVRKLPPDLQGFHDRLKAALKKK